MFVSKTYGIKDIAYYNDCSSVGSLEIDDGVSCTSNGSYITITTSTSGEKYVKLPITLHNTDDWSFSTTIGAIGTVQSLACNLMNASIWAGYGNTIKNWFLHNRNILTQEIQIGDVVELIKTSNTITMKLNGTVIGSNTFSFDNSYWIGYYTNNRRTQHLKDIKLQLL